MDKNKQKCIRNRHDWSCFISLTSDIIFDVNDCTTMCTSEGENKENEQRIAQPWNPLYI